MPSVSTATTLYSVWLGWVIRLSIGIAGAAKRVRSPACPRQRLASSRSDTARRPSNRPTERPSDRATERGPPGSGCPRKPERARLAEMTGALVARALGTPYGHSGKPGIKPPQLRGTNFSSSSIVSVAWREMTSRICVCPAARSDARQLVSQLNTARQLRIDQTKLAKPDLRLSHGQPPPVSRPARRSPPATTP